VTTERIKNSVRYQPGSKCQASTRSDRFPSEQRGHMFERFWRGKGTTSRGAGLGLAIVAEIMKAHHGSISVDDNPGGGTVFTLFFARFQ
jgi:signal transduction histidine kinase